MNKIIHLDLDQFFVAVERILDPSLIGKPVVVGGSPTGRGVVASASYEARKYGIRSAMPMYRAFKLCPHLIRVKGRHGEYSKYSRSAFGIVNEYSSKVERTSIDEGYIDLSESKFKSKLAAIEIAEEIKLRIAREIGLSASLGIGSNKMMAKIASKHAKPEGILEILPNMEEIFLESMEVEIIPGVGPKTKERLNNIGVKSINDLKRISEKELISRFGIHGEGLYKRARGISGDRLEMSLKRKSISKERTFNKNISTISGLDQTLKKLCDGICDLLKDKKKTAKGIGIKIRYENFETITRSKTLSKGNNDKLILFDIVKQMVYSNFEAGRSVRLIGVKVFTLEPMDVQTEIFV